MIELLQRRNGGDFRERSCHSGLLVVIVDLLVAGAARSRRSMGGHGDPEQQHKRAHSLPRSAHLERHIQIPLRLNLPGAQAQHFAEFRDSGI